MSLNSIFAQNVVMKRKERSLSQEQLALDVGIQRSYMSGIERGTRNPTLAVVEKIADALGTEVVDLLRPAENL